MSNSENKENREVEVRFLDVNKDELITKIKSLGGEDFGELMLEETIFYDFRDEWRENHKLVKIRDNSKKVTVTYKHFMEVSIDGTEEIEFEVSNKNSAKMFLEKCGLVAFREQQKLRHTFKLDEVIIDIDTWPKIPTYIELEGVDEKSIKQAANKLGLDWTNAVFETPGKVIEKRYNIPITTLRYFKFDRFE